MRACVKIVCTDKVEDYGLVFAAGKSLTCPFAYSARQHPVGDRKRQARYSDE